MHPGFNIIMRLNTTKQWMRLMWQYDTSVIIALRLKLSMTVWQKNRQARLAILCAEKMQDFRNPRSDWRVAFLKVRTNGLAKL